MFKKITLFSLFLILTACGGATNIVNQKNKLATEQVKKQESTKEALLRVDSVDDARLKAKKAIKENKIDLAQAYYLKAYGMEHDNISLLKEMATLYKKINRTDLVELCYQLILKQNPKHYSTLESYGLLLIKLKKYPEAEEQLLKVIVNQEGKQNWRVLNGLGLIKDLQNQYDKATFYFELALKIKPDQIDVLNNKAYSLYRGEQYVAAANYYQKALTINPKYQKVLYNYALLEARIKNYKSALNLFFQLMSPAEANNNIGYIAMKNGDYDAASYYLNQAKTLSTRFYSKAHDNLKALEALNR